MRGCKNEQSHICHDCGRSYNHPSSLHRHLQKAHGVTRRMTKAGFQTDFLLVENLELFETLVSNETQKQLSLNLECYWTMAKKRLELTNHRRSVHQNSQENKRHQNRLIK